jgi:regulator of RNase E activity RraB
MSVVELLRETAAADRELLRSNLEHGDKPELPRDLEFVLYAADEEKAKLVCDFVTDNGYGRPSYECIEADDGSRSWRLLVVINAPAMPEIVCTISGFITCLSSLFGLTYDGWGSVIRKDA